MNANKVLSALRIIADKKLAKNLSWFFKTGPGDYGEGDKFFGVYVPQQRKIAKQYFNLSLSEIKKLLLSPWHEARLTGLLILVNKYKNADTILEQKNIFNFYLEQAPRINNWDLVDLSAPYIAGEWLKDKPKNILYKLAVSSNLWQKRIAIVATFAFIKNNDLIHSYKIAKLLVNDKHDLIHKATGWMLREAGKRNTTVLKKFLQQNGRQMPRTMLRYAIEKFSPQERKRFLKISTKNPGDKTGI